MTPPDNEHHARIDVENSHTGDIAGRDINKYLTPGNITSAAIVLAIGFIITSIICNIEPIGPIAGQLWRKVFPPFPPAQEGESLIIVANFDDRSAGKHDGVDPNQYIYDQLLARVQRDGLDIRVEHLPDVLGHQCPSHRRGIQRHPGAVGMV